MNKALSDQKDRQAQTWATTDGQRLRNAEEHWASWLFQPLTLSLGILALTFPEPVSTLSDWLFILAYVGLMASVSLGAAMFTRARVVVHPDSFTVVNLLHTHHIPDGNVTGAVLGPSGFPTIHLADGTDITIAALQEPPIRQFFGGTLAGHAFNHVLARGEHQEPQGPVTTTRTRWNTAQKALAVTWLAIAAANVIHAATLAA